MLFYRCVCVVGFLESVAGFVILWFVFRWSVFHRKVGSLEVPFLYFFFPRVGGARGLAPWLLRLPLLGVWSLGHVRDPEVWGSGAFIGLHCGYFLIMIEEFLAA